MSPLALSNFEIQEHFINKEKNKGVYSVNRYSKTRDGAHGA